MDEQKQKKPTELYNGGWRVDHPNLYLFHCKTLDTSQTRVELYNEKAAEPVKAPHANHH